MWDFFGSAYILFLHLYDGLVVIVKSKLARREHTMWASRVGWIVPVQTGAWVLWLHPSPWGNCSPQHGHCHHRTVLVYITPELWGHVKKWRVVSWNRMCEEEGEWIHLDCQGVITPSSGPPINTSFLILRKFFFHSEKETQNTISYTKMVIQEVSVYYCHPVL